VTFAGPLGNAAAEPNPHRRPIAHRLPAGSFFGGFRAPAPSLRVDRSRQAGIRNPIRYQSSADVVLTSLQENGVVTDADHGVIPWRLGPTRSAQMSRQPDSTLDDPLQLIAVFRRQLVERTAERDWHMAAGWRWP
jgi:hypothetical protein